MPRTKTFFFEIFSEEIPAKMQKTALHLARETIVNIFQDFCVIHGAVYVSCASRRLCICIAHVEEESASLTIEKRGPKRGAPEQAIQGFLRGNNLKKEDLVEKNGYFYAYSTQIGQPFIQKIPKIIQHFIKLMPWPKSLCWTHPQTGKRTLPWIRPVHSVVCLWDKEPISFDIEEWGIKTGNTTYGHHFLSNKPLKIESFKEYIDLLKKNFVIVDYHERQEALLDACQKKIDIYNVSLKQDLELLDEVTGLIDYPFVVVGHIEDCFMSLPDAVLSTSMRVHQKYFSTLKVDGSLAPYFVALSNCPVSEENSILQRGFEKVLRARLSDAMFFYQEDLKIPLETNASKLDHIVFHEKLGTLGQKIERLVQLAPDIERAIRLCKLDLVSHMVGEFAELQGFMGAHYALKQGESLETSKAISDHYKPISQNDTLPTTENGAKLAIIDRLDSLVGFLGIDIKPTGSKDPFALRRAALGIIRISSECYQFDLMTIMHNTLLNYQKQGINLNPQTLENVTKFIHERLAVYLKDQKKIRYDIIQSVLSYSHKHKNFLNIKDLFIRATILQKYLNSSENKNFMTLFTRIRGLLQDEKSFVDIQESLFEDAIEKKVYKALKDVEICVHNSLDSKNYEGAAMHIASLKDIFERMFDTIQVHTDRKAVRTNRLSLLTRVQDLFEKIADFEKIQEEV